ncbi:MAG: lamin tail domain-containing protein, partial [Planctomycetes bacterium]|nr:lamin tail domain-containing protein [Planctomycetota bacterium]
MFRRLRATARLRVPAFARVVLTTVVLHLAGQAVCSQAFGSLVINEVHYHPAPPYSGLAEFVEVHNPSAAAVDLSGWKLTGDVRFTFPEGTI